MDAGDRPPPPPEQTEPAPPPRVLVLGGAGFIGRHAVAALLEQGIRPVIGSRHPERIDSRLPVAARALERRALRLEGLLETRDWNDPLAGVDVVLNCVGILRQRGRETYQRVHHQAVAALAIACRDRGVRLVHVSALGLAANVRSRFLTSKREGERAVMASGADWWLVRPSLLDGDDGYGSRWIRRVADWPLHPVPAGAQGRIANFHVDELARALAALCLRSAGEVGAAQRVVELGGAEALTLAGHLQRLRRPGLPPARRLHVPDWLVRPLSHLCDLLHLTPFSFGHWELLQRDNLPCPNRLDELLGHAPRPPQSADPPTAPATPAPIETRA